MHEMPVMESILKIVLKHAESNNVKKVMSVSLTVGELSDLQDEWMQKFFNYLSKDTIAEGATLKIERAPVVLKCNDCDHSFQVSARDLGDTICPKCKAEKNFSLESGREYFIKNMEAI